jgi:glycosyltransferase involved in cell wall biosynthesis
VGGLAEAIEHERTGLIVPAENPQALAEAIVRFFDQNLGPIFESNIKQDAARFDWERLVEQLQLPAEGSSEV